MALGNGFQLSTEQAFLMNGTILLKSLLVFLLLRWSMTRSLDLLVLSVIAHLGFTVRDILPFESERMTSSTVLDDCRARHTRDREQLFEQRIDLGCCGFACSAGWCDDRS